MKKARVSSLLLIAVLAAGVSFFVPTTRVLWARALIAAGPNSTQMWAFEQVKDLGPAAVPAAADLIAGEGFAPAIPGQALKASRDEGRVLRWYVELEAQKPVLENLIFEVTAERLAELGEDGALTSMTRDPASGLGAAFQAAIREGPAASPTLFSALRSDDSARRVLALFALYLRVEERTPEGLEALRLMEEELAAIAASDPRPLCSALALTLLERRTRSEPNSATMTRYFSAFAAAIEGPLRGEPLSRFDAFVQAELDSAPRSRAWSAAARELVSRGERRVAALAAGFLPPSLKGPIDEAHHRGLLMGLDAEAPPILRYRAIDRLRRARVADRDALPLLLNSIDLPGFASDQGGASVSQRAHTVFWEYALTNPPELRRLMETGARARRLKAIQACAGMPGGWRVTAALEALLQDPDPEIAAMAARVLSPEPGK